VSDVGLAHCRKQPVLIEIGMVLDLVGHEWRSA
jgi:hypothetical protein